MEKFLVENSKKNDDGYRNRDMKLFSILLASGVSFKLVKCEGQKVI